MSYNELREEVLAVLTPYATAFMDIKILIPDASGQALRRTLIALEVEGIATLDSGKGWRLTTTTKENTTMPQTILSFNAQTGEPITLIGVTTNWEAARRIAAEVLPGVTEADIDRFHTDLMVHDNPDMIAVRLTHETTPQILSEYLSDAWGGIHYWAGNLSDGREEGDTADPNGFVVVEQEAHDGEGRAKHIVTWQQLADALALMASGFFTNYDGTRAPLSPYHIKGALFLLLGGDAVPDGDYDAHTWDIAIQQAALGKVVYG